MTLTLTTGTLEPTDTLDGWIITSDHASAVGADDVPLRRGDIVTATGDVVRDGRVVANIQ